MSWRSIKRIAPAIAGADVVVALLISHTANAKGQPIAHSCEISSSNGEREIQRDDGKRFWVQVRQKYDGLSSSGFYSRRRARSTERFSQVVARIAVIVNAV
jgi:hypothetical protein